jgi:ribosomal protein L29
MAILKYKDMEKMPAEERKDKLKDLKLEQIKANVAANKSGKIKIKEIKRTIARLMLMSQKDKEGKNK